MKLVYYFILIFHLVSIAQDDSIDAKSIKMDPYYFTSLDCLNLQSIRETSDCTKKELSKRLLNELESTSFHRNILPGESTTVFFNFTLSDNGTPLEINVKCSNEIWQNEIRSALNKILTSFRLVNEKGDTITARYRTFFTLKVSN